MIIYMVCAYDDYGEMYETVGIFSTAEKAIDKANLFVQQKQNNSYDGVIVNAVEVDNSDATETMYKLVNQHNNTWKIFKADEVQHGK